MIYVIYRILYNLASRAGGIAVHLWTSLMKLLDIIKIIAISLVSLLIGATILGCIIKWPIGLLAGPFLILFGWFYIPIIIVMHFIVWDLWLAFKKLWLGRFLFGMCGSLGGSVTFMLIGVKEEGSAVRYTIAYAIAAAIAAFLSCMMIVYVRSDNTLD